MDNAVKIVQLLSPAITITFGLLAFVVGLLAWRQQLLDKRKFEIAEQALVGFAKVAEAIHELRQRPRAWEGMYVWVEERYRALVPKGGKISDYRWHMGRREFWYRLDPKALARYEEVHAELEPIRTLVRTYLSKEIEDQLLVLRSQFWSVRGAAEVLSEINPNPPSDPDHYFDGEPVTLDPGDPAEAKWTPEEEIKMEASFLPQRWEATPFDDHPDRIVVKIQNAETELKRLCQPYMDINPYSFLKRLFQSLNPKHKALPD